MRPRSGAVLLVALAAVVLPWPVPAQQVLLHFPLDGSPQASGPGAGDAKVYVAAGGSPPTTVPGKFGQALRFDGSATIAMPLSLDVAAFPNVTVTAWVKVESGSTGQRTVFSAGNGNVPKLFVYGDRAQFVAARGALMFGGGMPRDEWVFVAGVIELGKARLEVHQGDGRQVQDGIVTANLYPPSSYRNPDDPTLPVTRYVFIGSHGFKQWPARQMAIDDVRVYSRALSDDEIRSLRSGGQSLPQESGPVRLGGELPATATSVFAGTSSSELALDPSGLPDRPTDILDVMKTPLSRAQIVLNPDGAIAYLSVGTRVTAPWGNRFLAGRLREWAESGKPITEIAGNQGQHDAVAVAGFTDFDTSPDSPATLPLVDFELQRAVRNGERIDLVALPRDAATTGGYFIVTDRRVYARGIPQAAVHVAESALAAGSEVSAAVFPAADSFVIATSAGIYTANVPEHSGLKSRLQRLHQAGERIEDIAIHPPVFGRSGDPGGFAIATDRRIVGVNVGCLSFDRSAEWARDNDVPRQISCEGDRPLVADDAPPPQQIPDLELKDGQCEWGYRGTLAVHHGLDTLQEHLGRSPLRGVLVRVSGSTRVLGEWGPWNAWPSVRTDDYGRFAIRAARDCGKRRMKLEIKFQDDELEVRHRTSTSSLTKVKWYEIDSTQGDGGQVIVDDYELGKPADSPGIVAGDAADMWWHADIWVLYRSVIRLMKARGPDFEFRKQVKIKYPNDGAAPDEAETSYANPENGVIYITNKGSFENFTVETLLHELGHIWSYQHSADSYNMSIPILGVKRLSCLTLGFLKGARFQTHGLVADRCVAFYEGFAEYFKDHVSFELFRHSHQACGSECPRVRPVPFSRAFLGFGPSFGEPREPVTNLELLQRHDMGWYSALHALTDRNRGRHRYGPPYPGSGTPDRFVSFDAGSACSGVIGPDLEFWDVLRAFSPGAGYPYFRPIRLADERLLPELAAYNDTRLGNFLARLAAISGKLDNDDLAAMRRIIDPSESVEPRDLFCP